MAVIYKTLFEIRLLHEFYLTRRDGTTIFEHVLPGDREAFLDEEFREGHDPVNEDVEFRFPQQLMSFYENFYIKIFPTYSGCRIAVKVKQSKLPDQTTVFEPLIPSDNDMHVFILALRRNPAFDQYSNRRLSTPLPATYYFSNDDITGAKAFPFLTNGIPAKDVALAYEQGELSLSGAVVQEFYRKGNADVFRNVKGSGFANESDRILLPGRFEYAFPDTVNLTQVTFVLKDNTGNELVSFTKNDTAGIPLRIPIDMAAVSKQLRLQEGFSINQQFHTLSVSGNNGFTANHKVIFSDELTMLVPWCVCDMRMTVTNGAFNLFANDGFLFRRRDALGNWLPAPVFEIPVKSRLAYWRYLNNKGKDLNVSAGLTNYVDKEGTALVTKTPRSLARSWFFLREEGSTNTTYAPNPDNPLLKIETDRRSFFDIRVPDSDLFPEL
jgi:hypothetical protein